MNLSTSAPSCRRIQREGHRRATPRYLSPLHKAFRQLGIRLEERMVGLGILLGEGHLLSFLLSYEPSPISELIRVFGLKRSTLTGRLDRLVDQGSW